MLMNEDIPPCTILYIWYKLFMLGTIWGYRVFPKKILVGGYGFTPHDGTSVVLESGPGVYKSEGNRTIGSSSQIRLNHRLVRYGGSNLLTCIH